MTDPLTFHSLSQYGSKLLRRRRELSDARAHDLIGNRHIDVAHRSGDPGMSAFGKVLASAGNNHGQAAVLMRVGFGMFVNKDQGRVIEQLPSPSGTTQASQRDRQTLLRASGKCHAVHACRQRRPPPRFCLRHACNRDAALRCSRATENVSGSGTSSACKRRRGSAASLAPAPARSLCSFAIRGQSFMSPSKSGGSTCAYSGGQTRNGALQIANTR